MPRARLISPEFWTSESVVDCPPMTRLLLLDIKIVLMTIVTVLRGKNAY